MTLEQRGSGWETGLKVIGIGRFIGAGFLAFWLAGWAVGEVVALRLLIAGAWSFITGQPSRFIHDPVTVAAGLPVALFLLLWLTLWTFGGLMAGRELLRLLFGRDRLLVQNDGLGIEHSFGLFRSRKRLSREEIRRFHSRPAGGALCVETTRGTIVLTQLGASGERAELEQKLNQQFNIPPQAEAMGALPKEWREELSLERDSVLVRDPAIARRQARIAWIICACLSLLPLYLVSADRQRPDLARSLIVSVVLAGGMGCGAYWLTFARKEWRLEKGRLVLQRRFGQNRTQLFEATSLELIEDSSGDHGTQYVLQAAAAGAPPQTGIHRVGVQRRTVYSQSSDPTAPRKFGVWLSERCGVSFTDLTTAKAKAKDLEELKKQLATSGRVGRVALHVVEAMEKRASG